MPTSTTERTSGLTVAELTELTPTQVANRIGIPLENWPGNCFGIALAMVEAGLTPPGSRAVYGHWIGDIAPTSMFARRAALGFTGHGWVLTADDQVIDPTRYVFEDASPYVYIGGEPTEDMPEVCRNCEHLEDEHEDWGIGRCGGGDLAGYDCGDCIFEPTTSAKLRAEANEYDEGGNRFREATMRPFPTDAGDPATGDLPGGVKILLTNHGHDGSPLTIAQVFWLANLPLSVLGGIAGEAYQWLLDSDFAAYIPIDNRMKVLG